MQNTCVLICIGKRHSTNGSSIVLKCVKFLKLLFSKICHTLSIANVACNCKTIKNCLIISDQFLVDNFSLQTYKVEITHY